MSVHETVHETVEETPAPVRAQYEAYPFPVRRPERESARLVRTSLDHLARVDHHCFGGRLDTTAPLRVLVAGGGTGDAVVYLAEQLRGTGSEIVYVDLSEASLEIARARAAARDLHGIRWIRGSLLDVPSLGVGPFDYVNCVGVLHHLDDPAAGLAALRKVLAPGGGMGLMLYRAHGRRDVYRVQTLLRALAPPEWPLARRIAVGQQALLDLDAAGMIRYPAAMRALYGQPEADAYFVDTYLHATDRPFTVADLARLLSSAGLHLAGFTHYFEAQGRVCPMDYDPRGCFSDPEVTARLGQLDAITRAHLAEVLCARISMHALYASDHPRSAAALPDLELVPYFPDSFAEEVGRALPDHAEPSVTVHLATGRSARMALPPEGRAVLRRLDGRTSTRDLLTAACASPEADPSRAIRTLRWLSELGLLLLRAPDRPPHPPVPVARKFASVLAERGSRTCQDATGELSGTIDLRAGA